MDLALFDFDDLSRFDTIHAYGDTPEDEAMLALAQRRWYCGQERTGEAVGDRMPLNEAA